MLFVWCVGADAADKDQTWFPIFGERRLVSVEELGEGVEDEGVVLLGTELGDVED